MKWSRYNYLFEGEGKYFIYNSLSNSFIELEHDIFKELKMCKENNEMKISDAKLKEQLIRMKIFVDDDRDELNKIKYKVQKKRFSDNFLNLTINPTLNCNFACPYCFEGNEHPNISMSDKVEDEIIDYIKKHKNAKSLRVTWFGGEPLLAFNRIVSLTNRMKDLNLSYNAGIITNGYLFTEKMIRELPSLYIKKIQITIDGSEKLHDSRRCLKSGKGTFQKIVNNITLLQKLTPEIKVIIRVNIDETNRDEYIKIVNFFKEKKFPNLFVSPGFVNDVSDCNQSDCIFNRAKKVKFILDMHKEYGIYFPYFYPLSNRYECSVRNHNVIVIGPKGEIYKCWNDVGNARKIVGYLNGKIENENLLIRYLNGADPFDSEECKKCILLPVCEGGCPSMRIEREYENKDIDVCSLLKDNMEDFLLIHYHHKLKEASILDCNK